MMGSKKATSISCAARIFKFLLKAIVQSHAKKILTIDIK